MVKQGFNHYYTKILQTQKKIAYGQTFLASVSFQTFPAMPRTITTTIWKTKIAPVNLSIIASIAVSFGSGTPLLIPNFVSLPKVRWYQRYYLQANDTKNCRINSCERHRDKIKKTLHWSNTILACLEKKPTSYSLV